MEMSLEEEYQRWHFLFSLSLCYIHVLYASISFIFFFYVSYTVLLSHLDPSRTPSSILPPSTFQTPPGEPLLSTR